MTKTSFFLMLHYNCLNFSELRIWAGFGGMPVSLANALWSYGKTVVCNVWFEVQKLKHTCCIRTGEKGSGGFHSNDTDDNDHRWLLLKALRPCDTGYVVCSWRKRNCQPICIKYRTLQYRYLVGKTEDEPTTVCDGEMERFIPTIGNTEGPMYYRPGELTEAMYGWKVRIVGGMLDGYKGRLLSVKGMRKHRFIIELLGFITVAVEVEPNFIQIIQ